MGYVLNVSVYGMRDGCGSPFVFPISLLHKTIYDVKDRLEAEGVEIRSLMGGAITLQPAYAKFDSDGLPNCLAIGNSVLFYYYSCDLQFIILVFVINHYF
jgi:hypothetical protein